MLVGVSGTHVVCIILQNVKLVVSGAKLYDLIEKKVQTYNRSLSKMIWNVSCISATRETVKCVQGLRT
jgi:TATA-box binding protein (TBP) (component of TFIID and TFIIIB)